MVSPRARTLFGFGGSPAPEDGGDNRDEERLAQLNDKFVLEADEDYFLAALTPSKDYYLRRGLTFPNFYWATDSNDMSFDNGKSSGYPIFLYRKPDEGLCVIIERVFFESLSAKERVAFLARHLETFYRTVEIDDLFALTTRADQQAVRIGGLDAAISSLQKEVAARESVGMVADKSMPSLDFRIACMKSFVENIIDLRRHSESGPSR